MPLAASWSGVGPDGGASAAQCADAPHKAMAAQTRRERNGSGIVYRIGCRRRMDGATV
jgi:hypothetical protein